jgi:hypothetical protein
MPFPVETFSRTPQPRRLSNRRSARRGEVVDQRPAPQALPGGRHRLVKMLGAEFGGNRAGATGGPPGCSSGDPSCEPRRSSVSFAIRIPSKHVLRETDNRGPRCSDGRGVARFGLIDRRSQGCRCARRSHRPKPFSSLNPNPALQLSRLAITPLAGDPTLIVFLASISATA